ncbi:BNR repeat-containing protein [Marinoscillum sp. MHG1-6]|uniref:BNR repeat-containing protein n=1 Tax=Marinoscillum sp. MHG1-6 TaxID=2959627 RepID=UPI00215879C1|nr:BNR repeat-containing protein [Marinoscillum sp. MHG1-6]
MGNGLKYPIRRTILLLCLCILGFLANAQKAVQLVKFVENNRWSGNPAMAVDNGLVYVLYTDPDSFKARICKYDLHANTAEWSDHLFETVASDDASHNDGAIAIDGEGYLHIWVGMHNHSMKYYRSEKPGDISSFTNRSVEMPNADYGRTYPYATTASNGDVFMIARRTSSIHDERQDLYHWNLKNKNWEMHTIAAKPTDCAYMASLTPDQLGNIHIAMVWSDFHIGGNLFQKGMYMRFDIAENKFYKSDGSVIDRLPVSYDSEDADLFYDNKKGWGTSAEIQTPRLIVDEANNPVISFSQSEDNGRTWSNFIGVRHEADWMTTKLVDGVHMYGRPPVSCTAGRINTYVTNSDKSVLSLVSLRDTGHVEEMVIDRGDSISIKFLIPYDSVTDLVISTNKLFKIDYSGSVIKQ